MAPVEGPESKWTGGDGEVGDLRVVGRVGTWEAHAAGEGLGSAAGDADVGAGHVELGTSGAVGGVESYAASQYRERQELGVTRWGHLPMSSTRMR